MTVTDVRANIAKYESVKRKGVDYILEHVNPDGSYGPVEDGFYFYRLPWTFLVAGETRAALGICGWVRENMLTDEGDFDRGLRKLTDAYAYRNATFIYGAHMARQYDLSVGCMPFLLTLQDPASGGFANDLTEDGPSDTMDVPYTVGSGLACIATGNMEAALEVYGYLVSLWEQQDELPDRLYYNMSRSTQKVVREFPPEERRWHVVVAQDPVLQRWTVGGIASAFLSRLYMSDPNPDYISLARQYMKFSMESTDGQFEFAPVCKSGWGSSLLYQVTGDPQYRDWTVRMGDWFTDTQSADGSWSDSFPGDGRVSSQIHLVAEFVAHVDNIVAGLSSRQ